MADELTTGLRHLATVAKNRGVPETSRVLLLAADAIERRDAIIRAWMPIVQYAVRLGHDGDDNADVDGLLRRIEKLPTEFSPDRLGQEIGQ